MSTQTEDSPQPEGLPSNVSSPTIIDPATLPVAAEDSRPSVILPIQYADPAEVQRAKQGGEETVLPAGGPEAADRP